MRWAGYLDQIPDTKGRENPPPPRPRGLPSKKGEKPGQNTLDTYCGRRSKKNRLIHQLGTAGVEGQVEEYCG